MFQSFGRNIPTAAKPKTYFGNVGSFLLFNLTGFSMPTPSYAMFGHFNWLGCKLHRDHSSYYIRYLVYDSASLKSLRLRRLTHHGSHRKADIVSFKRLVIKCYNEGVQLATLCSYQAYFGICGIVTGTTTNKKNTTTKDR
jgi:hypothetical protein